LRRFSLTNIKQLRAKMAKRLNKNQDSDLLVDIVEVRESARNFFDDNQNIILGVVAGLVIVLGGWFAYSKFFKEPKETEAIAQIVAAQQKFEQDSFALALANPGNGMPGFADIAKQYSGTQSGNLALYYAGICCLNLGQFDAAVDYLQDYSPTGDITPAMKNGALGDAYSELNDSDNALSHYEKAVSSSDNALITAYYLKKLGMYYEKLKRHEDALEQYTKLKEEYPNTPYAADVDKYIIRASAAGKS